MVLSAHEKTVSNTKITFFNGDNVSLQSNITYLGGSTIQ
jgi:hypothetical protein